MSDVKKVT